jgi:hypothetical protein
LTGKDIVDVLKNFVGAISAVIAQLEAWRGLLPINPVIRVDLLNVSSIGAVICGICAHQYTTRRSGPVGGVAAAIAVAALVVVIAAGVGGLDALNARLVSAAVRVSYVAFFSALGAALGAFTA